MMSRQEAIKMVLDGMQHLIVTSATSVASEQYAPRPDPDASDDHIKDQKEFMAKIRSLRQEFEDVVTGVL